MARPGHLMISGTGRQHQGDGYHSLTPRTPRGRDHFDSDDVELSHLGQTGTVDEDGGYTTYAQQQSEPLLASSASESFPEPGVHLRGARFDGRQRHLDMLGALLGRLPLIAGIFIATAILGLFGLSLKRPDVLEKVLSSSKSSSVFGTSHLHPVNASEFISYENYTQFPLLPSQYVEECNKKMGNMMQPVPYWTPDLTNHIGPMDVYHVNEPDVCESSITYMLDGKVGLLADLALLAQTAALARERNRTFFVDDTYWNRGKWLDHFQDVNARLSGPQPGCKRPPSDELVACPRLANHWIVNSHTARFHFGMLFAEHYEDPYALDLNRLKPIFHHAETSFQDVIRLNSQNKNLLRTAHKALLASLPDLQQAYVGVHIRRGDRSIASFRYHDKYAPLDAFTSNARSTWKRLRGVDEHPPVYLASDAPAALDEYGNATEPSAIFSLLSSGVSALNEIASKQAYVQADFDALPAEDRIALTRGMIVDFGMISGIWAEDGELTPEAVVCGMSSVICNMAAVGFGWKRAFGLQDGDRSDGQWENARRRWVEVENGGGVSPMWKAYSMF